MRKILLSLAFTAIIVSSMMLPEERLKAATTFAQLKKTQTGQSILTAIQLELSSSSNQQNIVDNILNLLHQLLTQTETNLTETESTLASKTDSCNSVRASYEEQIEGKKSTIAQGEIDLPNLRLEKTSDEANQAQQRTNIGQAMTFLADAFEFNRRAEGAFATSIRNHNNMIEALQKARALIVSLRSSSFIQNTTNQILAQITAHTESSVAKLASHQNRDIYTVLMQMAQEVAIQSDQELVGSVVEIIDDLLKTEAEGVDTETQNEETRKAEYAARVQYLNERLTEAQNEVLRLEGEIVRLGNEISALESSLEEWKSQLHTLEETLTAHNDLCTSEIAHLTEEVSDLTSEIDIIKQVIQIFESHAIQDIKPVVSNLDE